MPKTPSTAALEAEVADLQRRLERTQFQMLSLCGEQMIDQLDAWASVDTFADFDDWIRWLGREAARAAYRDTEEDGRAACPICGSTPFASHGFKVPHGLIRHVVGSHGQPQCVIAGAAQELALACVRDREAGKWRPRLRGELFEREKPWARRIDGHQVDVEHASLNSAEVIPLRRPAPAGDS